METFRALALKHRSEDAFVPDMQIFSGDAERRWQARSSQGKYVLLQCRGAECFAP
jgi:hypothetical protein